MVSPRQSGPSLVVTHSGDGEILSEIAIHNFDKNRKIENRILPYEGKKCHRTLYLKGLKRSR